MIGALRGVAVLGLVATGLFFTLVSTVGVLRLPDVYARAHTASQADTLGAGFTLAGVALYLGWQSATVGTLLLLAFVFVTNPTAAHAIARAAHEEGIVPWTLADDRSDVELASDRRDGEPTSDRSGGEPTSGRCDGEPAPDRSDGALASDSAPDRVSDRGSESGGDGA